MNKPIRRVSVIALLLFLSLFASSTWIQYVKAPELNSDSRNVRSLYREFGTNRGAIIVGGEEIASTIPSDDAFNYQRTYADGPLYAGITGFYSVIYGRTGVELAANEYLNGSSDALAWSRLENLITGVDPQGSAIELTINPEAQKAAWDALGDQRGAAVAIDPSTGAILAMVSKPAFDPNDMASHSSADVRATYQALLNDDGNPLINRAIAGDTYPPGSVFKLVTAAAALEDGYTEDSQVDAPNTYRLPGTQTDLPNFGGASCTPGETMPLSDALKISCNTAFAILGNDLGQEKILAQAQEFGFGDSIQVPLSVTPSRYPENENDAQTALSAIGQQDVRVTPLQVAMVSAAIANEGTLMKPYLIDQVRNPDLSVYSTTKPDAYGDPISEETARQLTDMMTSVVADGTGKAAQISGIDVAGKTGTAETGGEASAHAWFTAFAPADNPQIAVAVVVENGGSAGSEATGGAVAAPIARQIMEAVITK
ncbi:peptidoglycan D,D-transpeptidase FtsI family protein [Jonesia quinghaiensis]|uniref:peptidoglycan D,D-transpeptidase FtsI family protein n=1 Tax=Jonesia quinghaiensis TaxID=262806 RepID=UPI00042404F2|nr:penicillin-binding transpeptidase domain-containing protein [Jonesia quinghaiensis]